MKEPKSGSEKANILTSCHAFLLSWILSSSALFLSRIPPVLHHYCLWFSQSWIIPVLDPPHSSIIYVLDPSCPSYFLSCMPPVLHTSCPAYLLSYIPHVLHMSCYAYLLSCINSVLHPSQLVSIWFASLFHASLMFCSITVLSTFCQLPSFPAFILPASILPMPRLLPILLLFFPAVYLSWLASVLSLSCSSTLFSCFSMSASLLSCLPLVLHTSCPASILSYVPSSSHAFISF